MTTGRHRRQGRWRAAVRVPPHLANARSAYSSPDRIIDAIRQALIVLDEKLRAISANRAFYRAFAVMPEETVDMVRERASTKRNDSIGQVDKTLNEVEDAMVRLPTSLLLAGTNESEAKKSAENLENAADRLNDAVKALNSDGASGSGAVDVKKIKQALARIHEDKMNLPRTVSMSGSAR